MDHNTQLKVQAWLDGELSGREADQIAQWLEQDREAAALAGELRNTCEALVGQEAEMRVPESREFYWSKIEREIRRQEAQAPAAAPALSYWTLLRRLLVPASALAVVVMAALVLLRPARPGGLSRPAAFETASADSGTLTYHDYSSGATLVWLSYPADNEIADEEQTSIVQ